MANKSYLNALKELPANIWHSIFRNPLPHTDLGRAQTSFTNFFLHVHPVKVNRHTLKPWYTMGLGLITFFLFVLLTASGVLLMFYYVPSTTQAYDRMLDLRGSVAFGTFLRNMHRWGAHAMVAAVFLHMARVFFTGSYKKPREFNWVIGVFLFLLTLFSSFTGYLLPWDQLAFWAITVGSAIAGYAPVVGKQVQFMLLGDTNVGQEALLRFYVLHIAVLPLLITLLVSVHFWRIRKDGGLSRPEGSDADDKTAEPSTEDWPKEMDLTPSAAPAPAIAGIEKRRFGIQGLVRGPFTKVGNVPDNSVFSWPSLFMAELFVFVVTVAGVLLVSLFFNAPLEEPVNILHPPNPAKAPWYFLGLQEMVSYSAFWGGVGIPTLEVLILLLVPYIDRNPKGVGVWFSKHRLLANTLFLLFVVVNIGLIIIGTFFRGPNWEFASPW
ncbi:MAG TPA: cytochrome b N-terminal domain-containing protein [Blastocatellia bacterium]|nr:cytochrome b N-terminal domain-containing protein [Blastocatellia bacterium]HMX26135.1 cytochrome b N-terminal domain-containing protein [Blastocatellia bacterium]HMY74475.1 cytochrome b N-terminal domain-containing protein [Blastocatellia bacterium]HMZ21801.1 cytochrome b N-terminal domain-containing protein [Blastocatellia bacterium]HNG31063.1 cytochrome b N-terminal domain-containing protein [Blastocatellia bacterium]